ncbi:YusW family protein [Virgibacillus alimentarius]|uniref:YusW-like protein n=1 Tax=Virgibacillus alimentarius TaxID=698769 RepID=A0ABS4S6W3_9BACI|nr:MULTISPECIES: YusW family protein [Virgibacillus]MBP2257213.1 hypothetical protein [Virgibacillus alimentarius]HLR67403.1 YusW family protein [Virgibacillus sp.]
MRKNSLLITMLILSLTLIACGTQGDPTEENANTNQKNEGAVDNDDNADDMNYENNGTANNENLDATSPDDMKQKMDELAYTRFELSVEYEGDKEYEASIEQEANGMEADLEDDVNGLQSSGEEAFNKIFPRLKKLMIDQNTNKNNAIKEALKAFDLDPDYQKFELEISFENGKNVEFEDKV